jgi:hypothetical protein
MSQHHTPGKVFPAEVSHLVASGVVPTWYAGPLYAGNGTADALAKLDMVRKTAEAEGAPDDDSSSEAEF